MHATERIALDYMRLHAEDSARVIENLSPEEAARMVTSAPVGVAAPVVQRISLTQATTLLELLEPAAAAGLLGGMELGHAAVLVRRLPAPARAAALAAMATERRERLSRLLDYPEGTAGAVMDVEMLTLPQEMACGEAWERVKATTAQAIYYVYVVQRSRRLVGVLNLKELATAPPERELRTVMVSDVVTLSPGLTLLALVSHPGWMDFHALPVVDGARRFMGVIRHETMRRLEREYGARRDAHPREVGLALGELYWLGLAKFTEGVASSLFGGGEAVNDQKDK